MITHLQKAIEESMEELDKVFSEDIKIYGVKLRDYVKSHLLFSQKKLIEILIEDLEGKKIYWNEKERKKFSTNEIDAISYEIAYNQAIKDIVECLTNNLNKL